MTERYRPLTRSDRSLEDGTNDRLTDRNNEVLQQLGSSVVGFSAPFVEERKADNLVFALTGGHGGLQVRTDGLHVAGAVGATFDRRVTVDKHATFVGCTFSTLDTTQASLVTVRSGAKALFIGCRFQRAYNTDVTKTFVTVDEDGKAVISGGMFSASNSPTTYGVVSGSGNVIVNDAANAATDCHVIGTVNHTTWALANTTPTGVI